jgi:hypothetical protein
LSTAIVLRYSKMPGCPFPLPMMSTLNTFVDYRYSIM